MSANFNNDKICNIWVMLDISLEKLFLVELLEMLPIAVVRVNVFDVAN